MVEAISPNHVRNPRLAASAMAKPMKPAKSQWGVDDQAGPAGCLTALPFNVGVDHHREIGLHVGGVEAMHLPVVLPPPISRGRVSVDDDLEPEQVPAEEQR